MTDDEQLGERIAQLEAELKRLKQAHAARNETGSSQLDGTVDRASVSDGDGVLEAATTDVDAARRKFLKAVAGGAAGLGMLGMASGFQVRSPDGFSFFGSGDKDLEVSADGVATVDALTTDEITGGVTGGSPLSNLAGNNLSIDSNGNLNAATGSGGGDMGVRMAQPGGVQAAIDSAADAGGGVVRLDSEATYDPGMTWQIKSGVTLDCNHADIVLSSDIDVMELHPAARVLDPMVDVRGVTYTSNVFRLDTANGDYEGENPWDMTTGVLGGMTRGTIGEGTCFSLYNQPTGSYNAIYFLEFRHDINKIGTGVDMHVDNGPGWQTSNTFIGSWRGCETAIHQHGAGSAHNNMFRLIVQPLDIAEGTSQWAWRMGANAENNTFRGIIWDKNMYANGTVWEINDNSSAYGNVIADSFQIDESHIVNNDSTDAVKYNNIINIAQQGGNFERRRAMYDRGGYVEEQVLGGEFGKQIGVNDGNGTTAICRFRNDSLQMQDVGIDLNSNALRNIKEYSNDGNAANNELYFDTSDGQLEYKDASGTIHTLG